MDCDTNDQIDKLNAKIADLETKLQLSDGCCALYKQKYLYELSKRHRVEESIFGLYKVPFKLRLKFLFNPYSLTIEQLNYFRNNESVEED